MCFYRKNYCRPYILQKIPKRKVRLGINLIIIYRLCGALSDYSSVLF